jgi:hypothetical protein
MVGGLTTEERAMLTTYEDKNATISDLAAELTDRGLEVLSEAGPIANSVAVELVLWRTLKADLMREARRRPWADTVHDFREGPLAEALVRRAAREATFALGLGRAS